MKYVLHIIQRLGDEKLVGNLWHGGRVENLCVQEKYQVRSNKRLFFLKNPNITFIYNKVINIIRNNKFINKSLIFNNKLMASFFPIFTTKKVVPSFKILVEMVPPWSLFFCKGVDLQ